MGFDYSCYDPCRDKTGKRWIGYYLTAYNLAVKHGFVGTEEEWLESLQGKSVMLRYNAETETLQWAYENTDDWKDILDINDLRSEIVAQTLDEANAAKTGAETAQGKAESAQEAAESAQTAAETAKGLAETAARDAASSAGAAEGSAGSAASSAQSAAQSAQSAMEYAGKPSKVEDGTWRVWNAASQAYTDTGVKAYTNPMGAYDPDTSYSLLDVVSYEGASYLALKDVQGVTPSNDGTNWMLLADKGDTGLAVGSVVKTGGTGAPGTTDTYTVYLTDNTPVGTITVYNGQDGAGDFKADGTVPMTGDLQMGNHKLTGLAEGTADTDGVNKEQMDAGLAERADLTLSNLSNRQKALRNIGGRPNRNLLDNWYFVGGGSQQGGGQFPINQRGQTSYTAVGNTIDRWKIPLNGATLAIQEDGILFTDSTGQDPYFPQILPLETVIPGRKYTCSAFFAGGSDTKYAEFVCYRPGSPGYSVFGGNAVAGAGLSSVTFTVPEDTTGIEARLVTAPRGTPGNFKAVAAKLELGPTQTLAYQDESGAWQLFETPDYGEELAKCQRYYLPIDGIGRFPAVFSSPSTILQVFIPTPVTMRSVPTVLGITSLSARVYTGAANSQTLSVSEVLKTETGVLIIFSCSWPGSTSQAAYSNAVVVFGQRGALSAEL